MDSQQTILYLSQYAADGWPTEKSINPHFVNTNRPKKNSPVFVDFFLTPRIEPA